jgi:hypothetical protein
MTCTKKVDRSLFLNKMPLTKSLSSLAGLKQIDEYAGIAQLVEHNLAKVGVASSSLVSRSIFRISPKTDPFFYL